MYTILCDAHKRVKPSSSHQEPRGDLNNYEKLGSVALWSEQEWSWVWKEARK